MVRWTGLAPWEFDPQPIPDDGDWKDDIHLGDREAPVRFDEGAYPQPSTFFFVLITIQPKVE